MNLFDDQMREHMIQWRESNIENKEWGSHNGKQYPFILPRKDWESGLWNGIRSGSDNDLSSYLAATKVDHHTGVHNLRSSWVLCANLYFPFRQDKELMAKFLRENVSSEVASVTEIELEYAAPAPHDPKTLLGEPDGTRGKNQTSPDVAFIFKTIDGQDGIVLTENKFVEHSFYACSGRKRKCGNHDRMRCLDLNSVCADLTNQCYLLNWKEGHRENRKYWDYMTVSEYGKRTLKMCPAAVAGYQLFRQHALAEALIKSGKFSKAISCVAYDERNTTLNRCLKGTGINQIDEWGSMFGGNAQFKTFTHQQWVMWVEKNDHSGKWKVWLEYVKGRYDL